MKLMTKAHKTKILRLCLLRRLNFARLVAKCKASEVMSILQTNPDLEVRALYQAALYKQYDLLFVVWDKVSPDRRSLRIVSSALMLVVRQGNFALVLEMAKQYDRLPEYFIRSFMAHAAYFGQEGVLRAVTLPETNDSNHATISILRGYIDHCVLGGGGHGDKTLLFAAIACTPPDRQRQLVQRQSSYFENISLKCEYYGVDCVSFVARHCTAELKRLMQKLIQASGIGLDIMVQAFQDDMVESTFWGLLEMTGMSTDQVASGLLTDFSRIESNVLRLLPSNGRSLMPLIARALSDGASNLFRAYINDIDFSYQDDKGNSFLHNSVGSNWTSSCFKMALEHGANPNCRNECGDTPLHALLACLDWKDIVECTRSLIAAGADCCETNYQGDSVICSATSKNMRSLRACGEFPQLFEPQKVNFAMQRFLERRKFDRVSLLIDWEVPVPELPEGRSILHVASSSHNLDFLLNVLGRNPESVNMEDSNGATPLRSALDGEFPKGAVAIFKHGGRYKKDDICYETFLPIVLQGWHSELLDLLLSPPAVNSIEPFLLKKTLLFCLPHSSY
jgi:hypothetical protein